jgi:hypothetical protein
MIMLLAKLWAFLRSPIGRWLAGAAVMLLLAFLVYRSGVSAGVDRERAANAKLVAAAMAKADKVAKASAAISKTAREKHAADLVRINDLTAKLQQKVPIYVTPQADRRCVIPAGYVRLRDAAGAGVDPVPGPAGGSLDADSGLVLSDLAANDLVNAAAFHTCVAEVKAWRGWYPAQADLWSKNTKAPDPAP